MYLNDEKIWELTRNGMIKDYVDFTTQLTPNGFDLTLHAQPFEILTSTGIVDFSNERRCLSIGKTVNSNIEIGGNRGWQLNSGYYRVQFDEYFTMPKNIIGIPFPRSSLVRNGATINAGIADAGWKGYFKCLLVVYRPIVLLENARILHMLFAQLNEPSMNPYEGVYKEKEVVK